LEEINGDFLEADFLTVGPLQRFARYSAKWQEAPFQKG
jgi:hypothetical protein